MIAPRRISVVIPTYQRCAGLQRALHALSRQTLPADQYAVIISIDGSQDGTQEMVSRFASPYQLCSIWQPNQGRAAACNAGVGIAKGELLVLLDDDMEPTPGFLEAHLDAHRESSRPGVVGAAPIILDQSSPPVVEYIGLKFNHHLEILAQPEYQFKLRDFYSGNFSIRRQVFLDIGGFDDSFKIYGNEDLELSVRLAGAGVQLVYNAEALAHQHFTKAFAALARDHIAKGRTAVLLARKHPETFPDLKLSLYRQASRKWLLLRAGLLGLSRVSAEVPDQIMLFMAWLERRRPARFHHYCFLALDYFYWLGAGSALQENEIAGHRRASLAHPAGAPDR
jgi:GT2 family glycosyltransferase